MRYKIFLIGAGLLMVMQPASAQVSGQTSQAPGNQQSQNQTQKQQSQDQIQQQNQTIGQRLRQNLQASGFTDIQVMPSSFLVRAKDREGNTVMMVVNPDSITAVTEIDGGQSSPSTTGQGNADRKNNPSLDQQNNPLEEQQNSSPQGQQNNPSQK